MCIISDHLYLSKYPLINKLSLTHELDFREVNIVFSFHKYVYNTLGNLSLFQFKKKQEPGHVHIFSA